MGKNSTWSQREVKSAKLNAERLVKRKTVLNAYFTFNVYVCVTVFDLSNRAIKI